MTSIIVVNYRNPPLLRLCLSSIKRVLSSNFKHEIVVVDIASSPETRNVVREIFPILFLPEAGLQNRGSSIFQSNQNDLRKIGTNVKLLGFKTNIGYTRGVNEGIKTSSGDYLLILNPDVVPMAKSIEGLTSYLATNTDVGLVSPRLLNFDGSPQQSCFKYYTPMTVVCRRTFLGRTPLGKKLLNKFTMSDKPLDTPTPSDWVMGSAFMASKKAIDKVGLMDEKFFLYMSDVDWARRFWENRFKVVYYPHSEMYHYHKRDSKGRFGPLDIFLKKESLWHLKDAVKYFRKYGFSRFGSSKARLPNRGSSIL